MRSAKYVDMCSGPVLRKMIVFTLPIMFSGLFQLLFNATDIIVVGRFAGDNALAAVGSNTALINLMTNLFIYFHRRERRGGALLRREKLLRA